MTAKNEAFNAIITEQNARLDAAEKSLRILACDYGRQRAVNMELLDAVALHFQESLCKKTLIVALREALK